MRKRFLKVGILAMLTVFTVNATEMRSPWISERGPIRYVFEKCDPDRYSLDIYGAAYMKYANKAFMNHGTDTKPLTELFFNKSNFLLSEKFNDNDNFTNEFQNPYLYVYRLYPRASYFGWGFNLGGRFEYPIYKDKGRIGARLNVPFRAVRIERDDEAERNATGIQDAYVDSYRQGTTIKNRIANPEIDTGQLTRQNLWGSAVNAELLRQIPHYNGGDLIRAFNPENNQIRIVGSEIVAADLENGTNDLPAVFLYHPRCLRNVPQHKLGALKIQNNATTYNNVVLKQINNVRDDLKFNDGVFGTVSTIATDPESVWPVTGPDGANQTTNVMAQLTELPEDVSGLSQDTFYTSIVGQDYRTADASVWQNLWISTVHNSGGERFFESDALFNKINDAIDHYRDNVYEWLWDNNFMFATDQRTGLGDIDLDIFYEHTFSDKWIMEGMIGLRFPTGSNDDYTGNPYRVHLGNGEHFEIKLGGLVAWQPCEWMNAKIDLGLSFALEATEKRCATFNGATIKNIGPEVDADVDWIYFVGRLDFNFFHPKTSNLSCDIGYEFYYKGEDNITFKTCKMETWLGKKWNSATGLYDLADERELDNKIAEANTEAIGHKIRYEGRWQCLEWMELFAGGTYVFAGQNLPKEIDCHCGANVKF